MRKSKRSGINIMRFDNLNEHTVYAIGGVSLLVSHIAYLAIFSILSVKPMIYYNIFSVTFYIGMLVLLYKRPYRKRLVLATLVEVMIHSCLGCYTMGWDMGFGTMLLFLIPIPFYLPLRRLMTPYLFSLVPFALYVAIAARVKFRATSAELYTFRDPTINNIVYFINISFAALILLYISSIYMFSRELMQFKLSNKNESLKKLATIDPLTQLFNRRAMNEYLKLVQHNCERSGKGYAVCIGDIDDFKKVNDKHGHSVGDDVLKQVASVIAHTVPAEGYAARWGGEEFLFIIPNADASCGAELSEKIREDIYKKNFKSDNGNFRVTMTVGICRGNPGDDIEKIISLADQRLYQGKQTGKNKTVV
ncbi:GGDEF domain-containing protein [Ruminococcus albus]|nr:GGDEF domain-containing protein [Ruminococcus albus]